MSLLELPGNPWIIVLRRLMFQYGSLAKQEVFATVDVGLLRRIRSRQVARAIPLKWLELGKLG